MVNMTNDHVDSGKRGKYCHTDQNGTPRFACSEFSLTPDGSEKTGFHANVPVKEPFQTMTGLLD